MLYRFDGREPVFGTGTYVSETAVIVGDVRVGNDCYIGHGVILRGDYGTVEIGDETAVEEGVVVHAPPDEVCSIGRGVILGHGAIIHAKLIGDYCGIGMGAILSIRSEVLHDSTVAEGSVVKQSQKIPADVIVAGNPAKKIRNMSQKEKDYWTYSRTLYVDLAHKYCKIGMERIDPTVNGVELKDGQRLK